MTTEPTRTDAYLSDDEDMRVRRALPEPCRSCEHLNIHRSFILTDVVKTCAAAGGSDVLGRILFRLAESGRCDEATPLFPGSDPSIWD